MGRMGLRSSTARAAIGLALGLLLGCGDGGGDGGGPPPIPTATASPTVSVTPSVVPTPTPQPTGPVAFAVSKRQVVRSDDGGRTWSLLLTVDETVVLQGVAFADRSHGWVVGGSDSGYGAALLRTEDGGATWTDQLPDVADLIGGAPNTFGFSAVAVTSPLRAVAVGAEQQSGAVFQPPALVAVTDDGGASWRAAPIRTGRNRWGFLRAVCLNPSGTGIAVGNGYIGGGIVLVTSDHGASWNEIGEAAQLYQGERTTITGAACAEPGEFWISGTNIASNPPIWAYRPTLLYSPFMGHAWLDRTPPPRTSSGLAELPMSFVDPGLGWSITGWILHRTDDAGGTWRETTLPGAGASGYYGVDFLDPLHGVVVGADASGASALATVDGGTTWVAGTFLSDVLPRNLVDVVIVP